MKNNLLFVLFRIIREILFSLHDVLNKYIIEKKYCFIYEISLFNGITNTFFFMIFVIFDYFFFKLDDYGEYFRNFNTWGDEIEAVKDFADALVLAGSFRTDLSDEQKRGQGDYGIIITAKFYNSAYKTTQDQTESDLITRQYILGTKQMSGQPYNFSTASRQYYIFPFDGTNLKEITSIQVYCKDFPKYDTSISQTDIYIKNLALSICYLI